jgi:glycosyltransferase involved in cell wall biosynthesis
MTFSLSKTVKIVIGKPLLKLFEALVGFFVISEVLLLCLFRRKPGDELIWGPIPIINNKYWSQAMSRKGWKSKTLMKSFYAINKKDDYDLYFEDVMPRWIRSSYFRNSVSHYFALLYMIRNASVVHLPFSGGPLGATEFWRFEGYLFRWARIKTVLLPYGGDTYRYSQVTDSSLRHALLLSYPQAAKSEPEIAERVAYWLRHADFSACGFGMDGMGRWDVPVNNFVCIDTERWQPKLAYSASDGLSGVVKVIHTPNHRGFKGTEFLIEAVQELRKEGLSVELLLLERVQNDEVRGLIQEADILAEQFIATGYALSAIEGMASGLAVMSNLEHEFYTRIFRRYAFLNECPIVSTSPETIKRNLRVLITNPALREQLGRAGRQYVEKYHSYEAAQYLFGSIYAKLLEDKDIDLMNLFHPLKSEFNRRRPKVEHPLVENQLPAGLIENSYSLPYAQAGFSRNSSTLQ